MNIITNCLKAINVQSLTPGMEQDSIHRKAYWTLYTIGKEFGRFEGLNSNDRWGYLS